MEAALKVKVWNHFINNWLAKNKDCDRLISLKLGWSLQASGQQTTPWLWIFPNATDLQNDAEHHLGLLQAIKCNLNGLFYHVKHRLRNRICIICVMFQELYRTQTRCTTHTQVTVQTISWTVPLSTAADPINADAATGNRTELEVKKKAGKDNFHLINLFPRSNTV